VPQSGIAVLPPSVNRSQLNFEIEEQADGSKAIRFGLTAIKTIGFGAVETLIASASRRAIQFAGRSVPQG
jgi:DNA polymerase-3 subunit alpha